MELSIAPPPRIAAGVQLRTPLVVTFRTAPSMNDAKQESDVAFGRPDLSGVWAFLSLTTPDMQKSLVPPRTDLLQGRTADSIHPIYREQEGERPMIAYATFPELMITQPGSYRIRVNIIDMNAALMGDTANIAGTVLPPLHSQVFDVVEGEDHYGSEPKILETVSRLKSIGINIGVNA